MLLIGAFSHFLTLFKSIKSLQRALIAAHFLIAKDLCLRMRIAPHRVELDSCLNSIIPTKRVNFDLRLNDGKDKDFFFFKNLFPQSVFLRIVDASAFAFLFLELAIHSTGISTI